MNIRIMFYNLFRSPVQKSVRCPFFFFKLFATGIPDRYGLKLNTESIQARYGRDQSQMMVGSKLDTLRDADWIHDNCRFVQSRIQYGSKRHMGRLKLSSYQSVDSHDLSRVMHLFPDVVHFVRVFAH